MEGERPLSWAGSGRAVTDGLGEGDAASALSATSLGREAKLFARLMNAFWDRVANSGGRWLLAYPDTKTSTSKPSSGPCPCP